jgi:hypothetical protein
MGQWLFDSELPVSQRRDRAGFTPASLVSGIGFVVKERNLNDSMRERRERQAVFHGARLTP